MKENQEEEEHLVSMIGMNQDMVYIYYIMEDVLKLSYLDVFSSNDGSINSKKVGFNFE